jgi:hypothetical protein
MHSDVTISLLMNLPLLIYTLVPLSFAWQRGTWPAIPFLCLFPLGFCLILSHDLRHLLGVMAGRFDRWGQL